MLKISKNQQKTFSKAAEESFLEGLRQRLIKRSPDLTQTFNKARLNTVVNHAVVAAKKHGFTNRGPIRLYLDLYITFGSGFVDDPIYTWAAEAIGNQDPKTQMDRAETLFTKSLTAVDEIHGPEGIYSLAALRALSTWAHQPFNYNEQQRLEDYAISQMRWLHPEKAKHAGEKALYRLFHEARISCLDFGVTEPRALILTTTLKFAFGAGCLKDPVYGWIDETLSRKSTPNAIARFKHLERKALIWLDAILSKQIGR